MQIRYRITIVYTFTVTIVLLLLCAAIYYFSYQNRTQQFYERLELRAISTADLLWKYDVGERLVKEINLASPGALIEKSVIVYDSSYRKIFSYSDPGVDSFEIDDELLKRTVTQERVTFRIGRRNSVIIPYRNEGRFLIVVAAAYDEDKAEWLPKMLTILVVSFIAAVSIVVIIGYLFSLRLVRSISSLTNRINQISSAKFSERLEAGEERDELQQLAGTINNLLDRLQSSFETQRRFIDNASHELSTPLASIGSQLDVVLQRERDLYEYKRVISSVNDDVKRLGFLVKSLLEIAKLSGSAKGIELVELRIDEILMRLPSEMKKIDSTYEVKLEFQDLPDEEEALTLHGNEELLVSAFKNIVHNACKFSPDHTAIVRLSTDKDQLKVAVEDHGPGISAEEFKSVFQPFFRSERTSIISGSGLGLPLAQQIIRLYGGQIEVFSEKGKGTTFTITLSNTKPDYESPRTV